MKQQAYNHLFLLFALSFLFFTAGCSDDDEIASPKDEQEAETAEYIEINQFIEENMSIYYFWNEEMPDIAPKEIKDPKEYFNSLLYSEDGENGWEDKWSFITDDYQRLIDYFSGIRKDPGYSVLPVKITEEGQIVAFVEFVYPGTPAEEKGLKRGDIIYRIDDRELNTDNYSQLLSQDAFTITLGKINSDGEIVETSTEISLEARELNLNPIVETSIIDTAGHKIGYLAYASFISNYDAALADTIEYFQNHGVTDFVLDLRYNNGGAISSARKLSEMLVPKGNEGNIFIKEQYNDLITESFKERYNWTADSFQINFRNPEEIEDVNTRLDIDQLYVLTTSSTASASEMIIYGLEPYMDVVQIGGKTLGKYYGSATFSEEEEHSWAIQPLIVRLAGANDDLDYYDGLPPDHSLDDFNSITRSDQLGEPGELFLAKAISNITGEPFPYEDDLKSLEELKPGFDQNTQELKKKLNPWYGKMWTTIPEIK